MNDVSLREYIERIIDENNLRRDDQLRSLERKLDTMFSDAEKALKLQADAYEKRMSSYPQQRDFIELKGATELALSDYDARLTSLEPNQENYEKRLRSLETSGAASGASSRGVLILFQLAAGVAVFLGIVNMLWNFTK